MGVWFYVVCFIITLLVLLWALSADQKFTINQTLFIITVTVGNGGYLALALARTLEEAILANKLTYLIGVFGPMIMMTVICDVCLVEIKTRYLVIMYSVQMVVYLMVLTTGYATIFYKTIDFDINNGVGYLIKSYGPAHALYLISLYGYVLAGIVVAINSAKSKKLINRRHVDFILLVDILATVCYATERFLYFKIELMPVIFTTALIANLAPLYNIKKYSLQLNSNYIREKINSYGYIVIDKQLSYRGCNEYAQAIFPELSNWEIDKRIPGAGGRFNTFLRQPFKDYIETKETLPVSGRPFEIKGQFYQYRINRLLSENMKHTGYVIEITDVTEAVMQDSEKV